MNIDIEQLEAAFARVIEGIKTQDMPAHLKKKMDAGNGKSSEQFNRTAIFCVAAGSSFDRFRSEGKDKRARLPVLRGERTDVPPRGQNRAVSGVLRRHSVLASRGVSAAQDLFWRDGCKRQSKTNRE